MTALAGVLSVGLLLLSGAPSTMAAGRIHGGSLHVKQQRDNNMKSRTKAHKAPRQDSVTLLITFYGFPDNSPPGTDISNPQIHDQAGGTGTFDDPETFATDVNEFAPGTIIYVPFLQKYFIMEDTCTECTQDFNNGKMHVDLWVGGTADDDAQAIIDCEDSLTQDAGDIIVDPDSGLDVDDTPLFNSDNESCFSPGRARAAKTAKTARR